MDNIQNLLNQISIINEKNAELLEASGGNFNMFRVCGVNRLENPHSKIIAEFLNPQGSHGLKHKFLECFIETLGEECKKKLDEDGEEKLDEDGKKLKEFLKDKKFNCENACVKIRVRVPEGELDILIKDNQNKAIIIENKIYHGDEWEQLKRYDTYAKREYPNKCQILYLTLDGKEASEQSAEGVDYLQISHRETIINWLEKCVAIAVRFPMVRETIIQYINHLKQLTNQDMDTKNKEEIVNMIVGNPKFLESAEYICTQGILDGCKVEIVKNLANTIKTAADRLKLKCMGCDTPKTPYICAYLGSAD